MTHLHTASVCIMPMLTLCYSITMGWSKVSLSSAQVCKMLT